jgi:hypothetical protein
VKGRRKRETKEGMVAGLNAMRRMVVLRKSRVIRGDMNVVVWSFNLMVAGIEWKRDHGGQYIPEQNLK